MSQALIELRDLLFAWPGQAPLLDIPQFRLEAGEALFLKGPSGSGKTTLLGLLGGVNLPAQGSVRLLGQTLAELGQGARDRFRVDHTGYIFQQFNLLPFLSVRKTSNCLVVFLPAAPSVPASAMAASIRPPRNCSHTWAWLTRQCSRGAPIACRSASSNE